MPITRTVFIDDDGSGTTGTVWDNAQKQQLYDQIDAATIGQSGLLNAAPGVAGIGSVGSGVYHQTGKLITISLNLSWPANADAGVAAFSLPIQPHPGLQHGLYQGSGPVQHRFNVTAGTNLCTVRNATTGTNRTNQELSSQSFWVHGTYIIS